LFKKTTCNRQQNYLITTGTLRPVIFLRLSIFLLFVNFFEHDQKHKSSPTTTYRSQGFCWHLKFRIINFFKNTLRLLCWLFLKKDKPQRLLEKNFSRVITSLA